MPLRQIPAISAGELSLNAPIPVTRGGFRLDAGRLREILPGARPEGGTDAAITGIASLREAGAGELSFLGNRKYRAQVAATEASVVLLPGDYEGHPKNNQLYLRVENPSLALGLICGEIEKALWPRPAPGAHFSAVIDSSAAVAPDASVGPFCVIEAGAEIGPGAVLDAQVFIGREARVGAGCRLMPRVVLSSYCELGERVRLHSGVIIGADGFGYEETPQGLKKIPQVGRVVIGDDVEIGANTTVDRARFSETRIGAGTKIDNLVQIAHNVCVGRCCIIISQTGISGSVTIGDGAVIGGQVGTVGHITIGAGCVIGSQAGVSCDLPPGSRVTGTPARPVMEMRRSDALKMRLPELFKKVAKLEETAENKTES